MTGAGSGPTICGGGLSMRITVDGLPEEAAEGLTLAHLIEQRQEDALELIAEVNYRYIHRGDYSSTVLKEGDRVELILAAFGG